MDVASIKCPKRVCSLESNYGATRGKILLSPVIASVEVPYDMEEKRMIRVRGLSPLENIFDHTLSILDHTLLDINVRPFPDGKEQLHLQYQCYLPMYRFYCSQYNVISKRLRKFLNSLMDLNASINLVHINPVAEANF